MVDALLPGLFDRHGAGRRGGGEDLALLGGRLHRRAYGTGDPGDDDALPLCTETDADGATIVYCGSGEIDVEATAELAAQDSPDEDAYDAE